MKDQLSSLRTTATSQALSLFLVFLVFLFIQDTLTALRVIVGVYLFAAIINIWAKYIKDRKEMELQWRRQIERENRADMGKLR